MSTMGRELDALEAAKRLKPIDIHALLARNIPERQMILDPVVPELLSAVEFSRKVTRHFHTGLCLTDFGFEHVFIDHLLVVQRTCTMNLATSHEAHNE